MKATLKELLIMGLTPAQLLTRDSAGTVLVSRFGAVAGTNITNALQAACTMAVSLGRYAVVIDIATFSVDYRTDCYGCRIIGQGASLTAGSLINTPGVDGILIRGVRQNRRAIHPPIPRDDSPKLLAGVNYFDGAVNHLTQHVIVPKAGAGYVLAILRNDQTTNSVDSLGVSASNPTCWRVTSLVHAVEVLGGYLTTSASSGTWTDTSLSTDIPTYTSGTVYNYKRTTTNGGYQEYTITVPKDGLLTVGILESSGSTTSASITLDGAALDTAFTCVSATTRRRIRRYTVTPGTHTVRITNNTASGLNLLGLYFDELRNLRPDFPISTYGTYRNSAQLDPLDSNSANDYAIKVCNTDPGKSLLNDAVYGGSYHGGEGSIVTEIRMDGAMVNPNGTTGVFTPLAAGAVKLGRSIDIIQSCVINWSAKIASAGVATIQRHQTFCLNGYAETISVTCEAGLRVTEFYSSLFGLNENYQYVVSPDYKLISDIPSPPNPANPDYPYDDRWPLGLTGEVTLSYTNINTAPTPDVVTTSRITIRHTQHEDEEGLLGGAFLWRVPGSYAKYYYAPILRGDRIIKRLTSTNVVQVF